MTPRPKIAPAMRRAVLLLDGQRCAYCRSPMAIGIPMVVEHIIPLIAGGSSTLENLCLSCYRCNEFKGSRQTGQYADEPTPIALFHPRRQHWCDHFGWDTSGLVIQARTPHGEVTIATLHLNNAWIVQARRLWIIAGIHPPLGETTP